MLSNTLNSTSIAMLAARATAARTTAALSTAITAAQSECHHQLLVVRPTIPCFLNASGEMGSDSKFLARCCCCCVVVVVVVAAVVVVAVDVVVVLVITFVIILKLPSLQYSYRCHRALLALSLL